MSKKHDIALLAEESKAALAQLALAREQASACGSKEQLMAMANAAYSRALASHVAAGIYLAEARESATHGEWETFVREQWKHDPTWARRCIKVARDFLDLGSDRERVEFLQQSFRKSIAAGANRARVPDLDEGASTCDEQASPAAPKVIDIQNAKVRTVADEPASGPARESGLTAAGTVTWVRAPEAPASAPALPASAAPALLPRPGYPSITRPALSYSAPLAALYAHLDAVLVEVKRPGLDIEHAQAHARSRIAQGLALLTEGGIMLQGIYEFAREFATVPGIDDDVTKLARRLGRSWRDARDTEQLGHLENALPLPITPHDVAAQATRYSRLDSSSIRATAYQEHPILGRLDRRAAAIEPEQLSLLDLRETWARLDERAKAQRGTRGDFARELRNGLDPVIARAESLCRDRCGANEKKPAPEPAKKKADESGEGEAA